MPNRPQAKKRLRQDEKKTVQNKIIRSSMRTAMKRVLAADSPEAGGEALRVATKRIDKAAKARIIHANAAARYKSRLHKRVHSIGA